ncbi:hypothetical protein GTO89_16785 [Heliobacterium gestii]|uniref:Uncharacterized protein n=1 Tax=Heliomicrobium gestii TaxID=2699 RepID=A0A845LDB8_HELGE|nr:hypothetical protein [Heliomicrobium gestii]MBM7868518.1 hypothetical protein [Heliomicrobium gestii]MZP44672.1 hypothetical protein [Heliomicrobium gestii]
MADRQNLPEEVRQQWIEDILSASPLFLCRFLGVNDHPLAPLLLYGMDLEALVEDRLERIPQEQLSGYLQELEDQKIQLC